MKNLILVLALTFSASATANILVYEEIVTNRTSHYNLNEERSDEDLSFFRHDKESANERINLTLTVKNKDYKLINIDRNYKGNDALNDSLVGLKLNRFRTRVTPVVMNDRFKWEDQKRLAVNFRFGGFTIRPNQVLQIHGPKHIKSLKKLAKDFSRKYKVKNACFKLDVSKEVCKVKDEALKCKMDHFKTKLILTNEKKCPSKMQKL